MDGGRIASPTIHNQQLTRGTRRARCWSGFLRVNRRALVIAASHRSSSGPTLPRGAFFSLRSRKLWFDIPQRKLYDGNITEEGGGPVDYMSTGSDCCNISTREVADC